jgi:hypothetical protein
MTGLDMPAFTLRTHQGIRSVSLFDLLAAAACGGPFDLPVVQAHQRAPVVTALAIIMAALERHATDRPVDAGGWAQEWDRQIGRDALRLVAPHDQPAFLQPPTDPPSRPLMLAEVDVVFASPCAGVHPPPTAASAARAGLLPVRGGTPRASTLLPTTARSAPRARGYTCLRRKTDDQRGVWSPHAGARRRL